MEKQAKTHQNVIHDQDMCQEIWRAPLQLNCYTEISKGTYLKSMMSRRNHDIFGLNLFLTDPPFLVAVTGQPANHKNVKSVMCQIQHFVYRKF